MPSRPTVRILFRLTLVIGAAGVGPLGAVESVAPVAPAGSAMADPGAWPVVGAVEGGELRVYLPQAEGLARGRLTARAAFRWTITGQSQPVFGVVWLAARAVTDRASRTVVLSDQTVTRVRIPEGTAAEEASLARAITALVRRRQPTLSLDRILAVLDVRDIADATPGAASDPGNFSRIPPRILVVERPAVLLVLDGPPVVVTQAGSPFECLVNTSLDVIRDPVGGVCWLRQGGRWYTASTVVGPWVVSDAGPADLGSLAPETKAVAGAEPVRNPAVAIVVGENPAELVSLEGQPAFEPIPGTHLQAVSNTTSDLFFTTADQQFYLVVSGRWFRSTALASGTWGAVAGSALPADFAAIPGTSIHAGILVYVPGTPAARIAVRDARIAQTVVLPRTSTIVVTYDGPPRWEAIDQTGLAYATNSPDQVLQITGSGNFACRQGVWYQASTASGPWTVATGTPPGLDGIPADHPLYHLRFATIDEVTATTVYAGFTPGYSGSYVVDGSVVWGTGYRTPGGLGGSNSSRTSTWSYGMSYQPWTGRWGDAAHRIRPRDRGVVGLEPVTLPGSRGPGELHPEPLRREIPGRRPGQPVVANAPNPAQERPGEWPESTGVRPGQILNAPGEAYANPSSDSFVTDEDGGIFRRNGAEWQQWELKGWQPLPLLFGPASTTVSAAHPNLPPDRADQLDRQQRAADQGRQRAQEFQRFQTDALADAPPAATRTEPRK